MKKLLFTLIAAAFTAVCFTAVCYAQDETPAAPAAEEISKSGIIDSVTVANAEEDTQSQIILDENGTKITVAVQDTTTIYDADMNATEFINLKKGDKVTVKYTISADGVNEAVSINLE
ncbi:MAG: VCBS domain-containing protein [Candidatus Aureabacteria bacterium]|nr:VCBS domain-containing protein [Candidatus Auribacterota bacterium]